MSFTIKTSQQPAKAGILSSCANTSGSEHNKRCASPNGISYRGTQNRPPMDTRNGCGVYNMFNDPMFSTYDTYDNHPFVFDPTNPAFLQNSFEDVMLSNNYDSTATTSDSGLDCNYGFNDILNDLLEPPLHNGDLYFPHDDQALPNYYMPHNYEFNAQYQNVPCELNPIQSTYNQDFQNISNSTPENNENFQFTNSEHPSISPGVEYFNETTPQVQTTLISHLTPPESSTSVSPFSSSHGEATTASDEVSSNASSPHVAKESTEDFHVDIGTDDESPTQISRDDIRPAKRPNLENDSDGLPLPVTNRSGRRPKPLELTNEEKIILSREGVLIPENVKTLTKTEERHIRQVRRKIKNKQSAADSRKRKRDYVSGLEDRVHETTESNQKLKERVEELESENQMMSVQLKRLKEYMRAHLPAATQGNTILFVVVISFALFLFPPLLSGVQKQSYVDFNEYGVKSRALLDFGLPRNIYTVSESSDKFNNDNIKMAPNLDHILKSQNLNDIIKNYEPNQNENQNIRQKDDPKEL